MMKVDKQAMATKLEFLVRTLLRCCAQLHKEEKSREEISALVSLYASAAAGVIHETRIPNVFNFSAQDLRDSRGICLIIIEHINEIHLAIYKATQDRPGIFVISAKEREIRMGVEKLTNVLMDLYEPDMKEVSNG